MLLGSTYTDMHTFNMMELEWMSSILPYMEGIAIQPIDSPPELNLKLQQTISLQPSGNEDGNQGKGGNQGGEGSRSFLTEVEPGIWYGWDEDLKDIVDNALQNTYPLTQDSVATSLRYCGLESRAAELLEAPNSPFEIAEPALWTTHDRWFRGFADNASIMCSSSSSPRPTYSSCLPRRSRSHSCVSASRLV